MKVPKKEDKLCPKRDSRARGMWTAYPGKRLWPPGGRELSNADIPGLCLEFHAVRITSEEVQFEAHISKIIVSKGQPKCLGRQLSMC